MLINIYIYIIKYCIEIHNAIIATHKHTKQTSFDSAKFCIILFRKCTIHFTRKSTDIQIALSKIFRNRVSAKHITRIRKFATQPIKIFSMVNEQWNEAPSLLKCSRIANFLIKKYTRPLRNDPVIFLIL